jgi:hypothetical protein
MHIKAIPSLVAGSLFLTFSSETGAAVKLVVAFLGHGGSAGSPLITAPFWVDPVRPMRFEVTEGLAQLVNRALGGSAEIRIVVSIGTEESQSGTYRINCQNSAFTRFEGV